jgi:PTH1 family peptidyl-tRNA hydrolase
MKLIIWLWNTGKQYEKTRHNVWFIFLNKFAYENNFSDFKLETKFKWETSEGRFNNEKTILLKPTTYMNLSWESLRKIVDFYKVELDNIIVIFDDKDMEFGKIRFRDTGSAWGHNWIKSIISHFWKDFKRIKIWIWYDNRYEVSDWVLWKFSEKNLDDLDNEVYEKTLEKLKEKIED